MDILMAVVNWFSSTILSQPAWIIGFIVTIGYVLLGKKWYEVLAGFIKASVGYMILSVGSSGLVTSFRPITVGLSQRFGLSAIVIDPYFGNNAVDAGVKAAMDPAAQFHDAVGFLQGANVSQYMLLLLFAYILNILLVAFKRQTKGVPARPALPARPTHPARLAAGAPPGHGTCATRSAQLCTQVVIV